jgi:RDD family
MVDARAGGAIISSRAMDFQVNPYTAPAAVRAAQGSSPGAPIHIAGRGTRFAAALIDLGMLGFLFFVGFTVAMSIYWSEFMTRLAPFTATPASADGNITPEQLEHYEALMAWFRPVMVASFLPPLLLHGLQCWLVARGGQSIAKNLFGIRIVRRSGESAGFLHGVVLRSWLMNIVILIPFLGYAIGVADALFIFGTRSRRLRDLIADTIVVKVS